MSEANGLAAAAEVMTPADAAAFLRVSAEAVVAEADAGRLPGRRVGGEWRFSRAAVLAWLAAPPEPPPMSSRDALLAMAGAWADDPTAEAMVEDIYRQRRGGPAGGTPERGGKAKRTPKAGKA